MVWWVEEFGVWFGDCLTALVKRICRLLGGFGEGLVLVCVQIDSILVLLGNLESHRSS